MLTNRRDIARRQRRFDSQSGWLRKAGKKDLRRLLVFLDKYASTMLRTMLRHAMEHLDQKQREHYLNLKKAA